MLGILSSVQFHLIILESVLLGHFKNVVKPVGDPSKMHIFWEDLAHTRTIFLNSVRATYLESKTFLLIALFAVLAAFTSRG